MKPIFAEYYHQTHNYCIRLSMISRIIQTKINIDRRLIDSWYHGKARFNNCLSFTSTNWNTIETNQCKTFQAFANLSLSNGFFKLFFFKYAVNKLKTSFVAFLVFSASFLFKSFRISFLETVENIAIIWLFQNWLGVNNCRN